MIYFVPLDYSIFTRYILNTYMEAHPIPQNISSFQFRLVGDMTLKQFVYLAAGSSLAYFLFVFATPNYPLLAWPLIVISALLGTALAFLGIGSRPLDHWLKAYLKAVYSPTKSVWRKDGKTYHNEPLFKSRYVTYLSGLQPVQSEELRKNRSISVSDSLTVRQSDLSGPPSVPESFRTTDLPTQEELGKTVDLARQAQALQVRIIQTERSLNQIRKEAQKPKPIPVDYHEQVNKILSDLNILIGQASQIKTQLDVVTQPEQKEIPVPQRLIVPPKIIRVQRVMPKAQELALTTLPNVINGTIKDGSGNLLEGVICVIYDKEGLPVRALKTNKLGQFSGSTPLPNGTYTLELEKENFSFDVLQIELTGDVLPALLITAKGVES